MNSNKRGWTNEEDSILKELVSERNGEKLKWVEVADILQQRSGRQRTGKQCRQRWQHQLDPNIVKNQWSAQEKECLFKLQITFGNKWAQIAQQMPGRTDNAVKNFFYSAVRKVFTKVNLYLSQQRNRKQFKSIRQFEADYLSKLMAVVDGNFGKRVRLTGPQTIILAKKILACLVEFINMDSDQNLESGTVQQMDGLIRSMHDFRRNCKKRKQKRREDEERQTNEVNEDSLDDEKRQSQIENNIFSSPQSSTRPDQRKYTQTFSIQKIINQGEKLQNNEEHTAFGKSPIQKLGQKTSSNIEIEELFNNSSLWTAQSTELNRETIHQIPEIVPSLFKTFSGIREQEKGDHYWQFLQNIPSVSSNMEPEGMMYDEWMWNEEVESFPLHQQRVDLLGGSQNYDSTNFVTKFKMLEASLALEQCLLNSRKYSGIQSKMSILDVSN